MFLLPYDTPSSCDECPICAFDGEYLFYYCPLSDDDVTAFKGERHPDCPIEERPHGEWIGEVEQHEIYTRICSSCGDRGVVGLFCMWCGASMKKEGDNK